MDILLAFVIILLAPTRLGAASNPGRLGLCLGNQNADLSLKSAADFLADLNAITNNTSGAVKLVRTYGAAGQPPTAQNILQAAKETGFQVLLGAWVSDETSWQAEKTALQNAILGREDQVYGITVGSEGLFRSSYSGTDLAGWMTDAKATWPNISIGTADTASSYIGGLADPVIETNSTLLLANAFPYWTNQFLQNSTAGFFDQTLGALHRIQDISGNPDKFHFMVGETGWPADGGSNYGNAVAGTASAQTYFDQAVCRALQEGIDVFWFEAFDESGKGTIAVPLYGSTVSVSEMRWGAMDQNRNYRLNMTCP